MSLLDGTLRDLKGTLSSAFLGVKSPEELAKENFSYYLENVIVDEDPVGFGGGNSEEAKHIKLQPIHHEIIDALENPVKKFLLIECPRGSGKSTLVNAWLAWMASIDPMVRCVLAARSENKAITQLNGVEAILRSPEHQRVFGNLIPSNQGRNSRSIWNATERVLVRPRYTRMPTFKAIGAESQIEGQRSDIIACDDIIDLESALSQAESEKIKGWLFTSLLPTAVNPIKTVVIGTPKLKDDLYEHIRKQLDGQDFFQYIHHPAIYQDEHRQSHSYWPERFTLERFEQEKVKDYWTFQSQYMLERVDAGKAIFKRDWLKEIIESEIPPREDMTIYQGIDPITGKGTKFSDNLAVATVGIDNSTNQGYLLDLLYMQGNVQELLSGIRYEITKWRPNVISIEADATVEFYKQYLENELTISLNNVYTKNEPKFMRIRDRMSKEFIAGRILLAGQQNETTGKLEPISQLLPFVEEWEVFTIDAKHDDALDAVNTAITPIIGYGIELAATFANPGADWEKLGIEPIKLEELTEEERELALLMKMRAREAATPRRGMGRLAEMPRRTMRRW